MTSWIETWERAFERGLPHGSRPPEDPRWKPPDREAILPAGQRVFAWTEEPYSDEAGWYHSVIFTPSGLVAAVREYDPVYAKDNSIIRWEYTSVMFPTKAARKIINDYLTRTRRTVAEKRELLPRNERDLARWLVSFWHFVPSSGPYPTDDGLPAYFESKFA
jgi:hypothetical protein